MSSKDIYSPACSLNCISHDLDSFEAVCLSHSILDSVSLAPSHPAFKYEIHHLFDILEQAYLLSSTYRKHALLILIVAKQPSCVDEYITKLFQSCLALGKYKDILSLINNYQLEESIYLPYKITAYYSLADWKGVLLSYRDSSASSDFSCSSETFVQVVRASLELCNIDFAKNIINRLRSCSGNN